MVHIIKIKSGRSRAQVMHSNICAYLPRVKMEGRVRLNRDKQNPDWSGCFAHIKSSTANVERGNVENG